MNSSRSRCETIFDNLKQTKILCLKSIEFLLEQQDELVECLENLQTTQRNAEEIHRNVSKFNENVFLRLCSTCFADETRPMDENQFLVFPFSTSKNRLELQNFTVDLNQLETIVRSIDSIDPNEFSSVEQFEPILFAQYTTLFDLAKKLTQMIQILHDTIELLSNEMKITFEHLQSAQPRLEQLLKRQVPSAF